MAITMPAHGLKLNVAITTEDKDGKQATTRHTVDLTVADQRAIVERETGGPCFRMWLSHNEKKLSDFADWTCYPLRDGRWAVWRKESDLKALKDNGEIQLAAQIESRRLTDDIE